MNATANSVRRLVLAGDGIGPEITAATLRVLREADRLLELGLEFAEAPVGLPALAAHGTTLPAATLNPGPSALRPSASRRRRCLAISRTRMKKCTS